MLKHLSSTDAYNTLKEKDTPHTIAIRNLQMAAIQI